MKTLLVTTPQRRMTAEDVNDLFPHKPKWWHFEVEHTTPSSPTGFAPHAIVVQVGDTSTPAHIKALIHRLAHMQTSSPRGSFVVFALKWRAELAIQRARTQQRRLQAIMEEINQSLQEFPNPDRVDVSIAQSGHDLSAKLTLIEAKLRITPPRPGPLDRVREVVEATGDLRVANGNLSATAVAAAFGISLNQLAGWLGRTRQALNKTPDADSVQHELAFFESVARLRAVVPKDGFQKWLRMPNPELDDKTPLDLLASGERQVLADLVDDMLTGAPN